jgi:threonine synthase
MTEKFESPRGICRDAPAAAGFDVRYVSANGTTYDTDVPMWRAPDGSHLNLTTGHGLQRNQIQTGERSIWRYARAIRVNRERRVSLGEGWTPLIDGEWQGSPVSYKLEYLAPTGSFKDRGASVLLTYLRNVGVTAILEDSSGNAGASLAAYSAAAGLSCRVLAPATAPKGKIMAIAAMGADVSLIEGSRQDVADAALREAETIFYASHNWQPFFLEGTKTLAFELWEQSGFTVPEAIVVPLGYGSNVLGLWLGFNELLDCGAIDRVPRIFAAQAANCAAFVAAWDRGIDEWTPFDVLPTVADGIAALHPVRMKEVLGAIRASGGAVLGVSEAEIATALRALCAKGLFVEPTCATAAAACTRIRDAGQLASDAPVVVVLTGTGLKATDKIAEILRGNR